MVAARRSRPGSDNQERAEARAPSARRPRGRARWAARRRVGAALALGSFPEATCPVSDSSARGFARSEWPAPSGRLCSVTSQWQLQPESS